MDPGVVSAGGRHAKWLAHSPFISVRRLSSFLRGGVLLCMKVLKMSQWVQGSWWSHGPPLQSWLDIDIQPQCKHLTTLLMWHLRVRGVGFKRQHPTSAGFHLPATVPSQVRRIACESKFAWFKCVCLSFSRRMFATTTHSDLGLYNMYYNMSFTQRRVEYSLSYLGSLKFN